MIQNDLARLFAVARPVHLRASSLNLADELFQILVEMIDCVPLDFRRGLARRLPIPVARLFCVARSLVFLECGLNERTMPQIVRQPLGIVFELLGGRAHRELSTSARWIVRKGRC
jgi:hypothetical protein